MTQPEIRIHATNPDGRSLDVTALCQSIRWSGDYRNAARMLAFSPITSDTDQQLPKAPTELGGSVQFYHGTDLLADAFSLERTRNSLSHTIEVLAYDRGLYLTRNSKIMRVFQQTPEAVTAALCLEFGIQTGELAATGVKLTRNFLGVSLYKIIMTLYTLAAEQNGKKYRIRFRGANLEVVEMQKSSESILLRPGGNLLSLVAKESASKVTNSVAIYDEQLNLQNKQEDASAVALYGLMQEAIKASAYDDPVAHAKKVLKECGMQTTITANCLGNTKLITGNTVVVEEPVTGTYGLFWILSDAHTWSRNLHQTKVTLSLEALMDSQTAGSIPTK